MSTSRLVPLSAFAGLVIALTLLQSATPRGQLQFETVKALATDGSEGTFPRGPLVQTTDGWIYGVTTGPHVYRIFRFHPTNVAETFTVLFDAADLQTGSHHIGDGGLVLAGDGNLYFVDQGKHPSSPCPSGSGWVGRVTPPGTVTHVVTFCAGGGAGDPINPYVGVAVGPDGALYGVANLFTGGAAIYRVGLDGVLSKVTDFIAMEGFPNALTAGPDGWLYGTTMGATVLAPAGQLYRVHPTTGVLEVVYTWPANGANGSRPRGRLLSVPPRAGYDLAFVGVTEDWGDYTCGVVYRLDVLDGTGTLTKLHDFTCGYGGLPDNGHSPQAGLVQHTNGLLYGATGGGPAGRIYRIGPEGGFAVVYNFGATASGDPVVSEAPLLLGADGDLYGTTSYNSAGPPPTLAGGSIFRLTPVNQDPIANAGPDQNLVAGAGLTPVTLDGSASTDPDIGDALTFEWRDQTNAVVGTTAIVNLALSSGVHTFTLTVDDDEGGTATDSVIITIIDTLPPTVTVVRPDGGEKLFAGTPYLIEWTASDNGVLSFFDVLYSVDAGVTYTPVPGCSGVSGVLRSCTWNSPGPTSTTARVRVVATDAASNAGTDNSNSNFTIANGSGSITVTTPNTTVDVGIGSTQQIKWNHTLGPNAYVRIELSRDGRESWESISGAFKNTGGSSSTFDWVVTGPKAIAQSRVRVTWVNGPTVSDTSDVDFSVSDPYVILDTASLARELGFGTSRTQKWITNLGPKDKVNVVLSEDGGASFPLMLASNVTATKKTADYTTPSLASGTTLGRVRIVWTGDANVHGTTPVNLAVQPAFVEVTQPNVAGDRWTVGSSATILWASNLGSAEQVRIELSLDGGSSYPIVLANNTAADGSHNVAVQEAWATSNARVRVTWVDGAGVSGVSSQSFVIQP